MQSINTLSFTPDVNNWLANTRHPRILHIFDRACNLINERMEILSMVTPQIGDGPFNLVLEEDILLPEYLTIASSISILGDQLTLGDLLVNIADAKLWSSRPDWEVLHAQKAQVIHPLKVAEALAREIANIAAPLTTSLSAAWLRSAGRGDAGVLWHQFFNALVSSNPVQVQDATDRILAIGETSGGDALAGFLRTMKCCVESGVTRFPRSGFG